MLFAFASLIAAQSFASYIVVLKGGKQYKAKAKWTLVNGKALVQLENGQSITIDPGLIDERGQQPFELDRRVALVLPCANPP